MFAEMVEIKSYFKKLFYNFVFAEKFVPSGVTRGLTFFDFKGRLYKQGIF